MEARKLNRLAGDWATITNGNIKKNIQNLSKELR